MKPLTRTILSDKVKKIIIKLERNHKNGLFFIKLKRRIKNKCYEKVKIDLFK